MTNYEQYGREAWRDAKHRLEFDALKKRVVEFIGDGGTLELHDEIYQSVCIEIQKEHKRAALKEMAGKGRAESADNGHAGIASPRQPNPEPGGHEQRDTHGDHASSAREPIRDAGGQDVDDAQARLASSVPKPVRQESYEPDGTTPVALDRTQKILVKREEGSGRYAPLNPASPGKPRDAAAILKARQTVETLFDYKLLGEKPIRQWTRDGLLMAHGAALRRLKDGLLQSATQAYDYAMIDLMLKNSKGKGPKRTTDMFSLSDLKLFDKKVRAMIEASATAAAETACTYLVKQTEGIAHVNQRRT